MNTTQRVNSMRVGRMQSSVNVETRLLPCRMILKGRNTRNTKSSLNCGAGNAWKIRMARKPVGVEKSLWFLPLNGHDELAMWLEAKFQKRQLLIYLDALKLPFLPGVLTNLHYALDNIPHMPWIQVFDLKFRLM